VEISWDEDDCTFIENRRLIRTASTVMHFFIHSSISSNQIGPWNLKFIGDACLKKDPPERLVRSLMIATLNLHSKLSTGVAFCKSNLLPLSWIAINLESNVVKY
jgi:hypothetical protein